MMKEIIDKINPFPEGVAIGLWCIIPKIHGVLLNHSRNKISYTGEISDIGRAIKHE